MFAEDLSAFMADFGSPVIFGSQTTWATLDQPDVDVLSGRAQSTEYSIVYPRTDLIGLANDSIVLIGIGPGWKFDSSGTRLDYTGTSSLPESGRFKVRGSPNKLDDGAFMSAQLQRI